MATPSNIAAPNLPLPPGIYDQQDQQLYRSVLRLFFTQATNTINLVLAATAQIAADQTGATPLTTVTGDLRVTNKLVVGDIVPVASAFTGQFSRNTNRAGIALINTATTGTDNTVETRFFNYDGAAITVCAQVVATDNNAPSYPNQLYLSAYRSNGAVVILTNNNTRRVVVNSSGNVAINAPTSGTVALSITPNAAAGISVAGDAAAGPCVTLQNTNGTDGRTVQRFINNLTTSKTWDIGIDISGGSTKAFGIRNITDNFVALNILAAGNLIVAPGVAITSGGSKVAGISFTSTTDFGVYTGSGAPTISAAKGSLYLRSDGTTTNDRAYINTNGSTTWTAITTVA